MSAHPLWDDGVPGLSMPSPPPLGINVPQIGTPSLIVADSQHLFQTCLSGAFLSAALSTV